MIVMCINVPLINEVNILYEKAELISTYHFLSSTCLVLMGSLNRKTLFTLIKASIKHSSSNMHI